jgi:hypothetical protein
VKKKVSIQQSWILHSLSRQMVIKPFKKKPALPANFEADTWGKLQVTLFSQVNYLTSVRLLCVLCMGKSLFLSAARSCTV